ncbi:cell wall metabolism sensor histidine kinase WalK [Candidatus Aquiluna sp. UB-MaderosW2red]|uniref:sensor histidine kinase n=1 Tax=Candidatus Aquiluna sp. UB-MaderosW2red TaxID=1855377 RepID=UPI000875CF7A|nr:ATP-binding protein [Candidatus Aquiluna sp. UB-MaderosW2red]SCX08125.1 Signal transduction histidine kinase [Candidatus Aquiluna sp. UB-MaderosW2red]
MADRSLRRKPSIRLRIAAASALIILLALAMGSAGFVSLLNSRLIAAQGLATQQQAETIAEQFANSGNISPPKLDDGEVQVFRAGVLIASSDYESAVDALPLPIGAPSAAALEGQWNGEQAMIATVEIDIDGVSHVVVVAQDIQDVVLLEGAVGTLLIISVPIATALLGVLVWLVVGRALSPVERIRSEVEAIESKDLTQRVSQSKSNDEISRLARTMNRMLERLDLAGREQRRFISDASHELRSPIASLSQNAQVALAHPESTSLHKLAELVDAESSRLTKLVEAMLDLAKIDEKKLQLEELDLDDIVLEEAKRQRLIGNIVIDSSRVEAVRVMGDRILLTRAIRNLADNARRHAHSKISFSCVTFENEALVRVDDDGVGIDEKDRTRIFERFTRLDEARTIEAGGAGLGLAIVAASAAAHGGSVSAMDSPLGGARLELRMRK